jgi:hypothetical protein
VILSSVNLPPDKLSALLNIAGKKLGKDPAELKQQLESGNLDGIMGKMTPQAKQQMGALLSDKKKLEALMADEKIKNLLAGIIGKK